MSEFIGSRISLISKSDIRYVGTLHEINSENSTVALENVKSFGTEGRRSTNPDEEVPPSDAVYEYIVFRGSDVKDLRIEEAPKENKPPPPQVPNDPAILGSGSRPVPQNGPPQGQNQPPFQQQPPFPPYNQYNQYQQQQFGGPGPRGPPGPNFHGPPPPGGFGGYPGMPYGAPPPGWYPPPGQGFPPGHFPPQHQQGPFGGPGQQPSQHNGQRPGPPQQSAQPPQPEQQKQDNLSQQEPIPAQPAPAAAEKQNQQQTQAKRGPRPPTESKPTTAQALGNASASDQTPPAASAQAASLPKKTPGIIPAVPQMKQAQKPATASVSTPSTSTSGAPGKAAADALQNATRAATEAVAAAMAKLAPMPGMAPRANATGGDGVMDNLTKKINEMRTDEHIKHSNQPGTGGFAVGNRGHGGRGGRGGFRGGRGGPGIGGKDLEVPKTDFDFESSNAKFNKQDLVKEAVAAPSPLSTPLDGESSYDGLNGGAELAKADGGDAIDAASPPPVAPVYNKSSFFDNLSSEAKERADSTATGSRGPQIGREMRYEERNRNLETFGLGSVDQGGYRGGFRGRGRGRGRGFGGYNRGGPRGGFRGGMGGVQTQAGEI